MNEHERDVTLKALTYAIDGIGEVLSAGNVNWSEREKAALQDSLAALATARRGLRMVEA